MSRLQIDSMRTSELDLRFALPKPAVEPVLDPLFRPAAVAWRAFEQRAHDSGRPIHARFALEQAGGTVSHFSTDLIP